MADSLESAQYFIYVTQIFFCAMYAVIVWDWVISLSREYRFIWKTKWTPVKIAYLFCRYWVLAVIPYLLFCFVSDHSRETCEKIFKIPVALAMWNQVGGESILLIRTYAFFNRSNAVLWFLLVCLGGVIAYQLYVDTTQMLLLPFVKPPFDKGPCLPMSKPHSAHLLGFFIAPLAFDTLVTFMTVVKAITIRRRNGGPNSRLIQTFIREGVFYYILISVANLINGIFYLQPRQVMSAINIPLSVMMAPLLACRLILDLRERGSETVSHSEGTGIAAFMTKSISQNQGSPFTPPKGGRRHKGMGAGYGRRSRGPIGTLDSTKNVVLGDLGTLPPDIEDMDMDSAAERDTVNSAFGMELGSLSTAIGGDDGEPIQEDKCASPHLGYHREQDRAFRPAPSLDNMRADVRGIRVDVEKSTTAL